jgi:hypothetical protein
MIERKAPLSGGIETYIDMVEREMEGGVSIQFPPDVLTYLRHGHLGGLVEVEEEIDVHDLADD